MRRGAVSSTEATPKITACETRSDRSRGQNGLYWLCCKSPKRTSTRLLRQRLPALAETRINVEITVAAEVVAFAGLAGVRKPNIPRSTCIAGAQTAPPQERLALIAAALSPAKNCGLPFSKWRRILTCCVVTAKLSICQSVDHPGSNKEKGRPLDHRLIPESCHPPTRASATRLALPSSDLPRPNGSA